MTTLDEFLEYLKQVIGQIADDFDEEDDDFSPMFLLSNGEYEGLAVPISNFFSDTDAKNVFAVRVAPALIKETEAKMFAIVASHWVYDDFEHYEEFQKWLDENPGASINENPISPCKEQVGIQAGDHEGRFVMMSARILRAEGEIPTITDWRTSVDANFYDDPDVHVQGRFVTPLMETITGRIVATEGMLTRVSQAIAKSNVVREMMEEAWAALGYDPEAYMAEFAGLSDEEKRESVAATHEWLHTNRPDLMEIFMALAQENMGTFVDEFAEKNKVPEGYLIGIDISDE